MEKLSICIICKNEEHNIRRCIESALWAGEVVIYDTGSIDQTLDICRTYPVTIYANNSWEGFGLSYRSGVNKAQNNWVFLLDADEEISPGLKLALQEFMTNPIPNTAYRVKRVSYFLDQKINYSGWQRDYTLRLFNRTNGTFNTKQVHQFVEVNCPVHHLPGILLHYTYPTIKTHLTKMLLYSEIGATTAYEKGTTSSVIKALLRGIAKFLKMYLLNLGFLDGSKGLALAITSGFGVYIKYLFIWEKHHQ